MAGQGQTIPDCIIAGAGPTGLTLALELARRGKAVRIFDQANGPSPEAQSRALAILPSTLMLLEPSGVTGRSLAEGLKITQINVSQRGSPKFSIELARGGGKYPFILSLPQGRTERILADALKDHGVEPQWNAAVLDVDQSGELPAFQIEREGKPERVEGRLVAGCDGSRSTIREMLNIPFEGDKYPTTFSLADVQLTDTKTLGAIHMNRCEGGVFGQLPLPNGETRLVGSFPDVQKRPDIVPQIQSIGWISDFSIAFRHAKQLQLGKYFLAGDAAHVHSPVGGRGMNTGIGDAAWLAWLMSEGREAEYEKLRLPVVQKVLSQTRKMTEIVLSSNRTVDFAVNHILPTVTKLPFVQKRIAAQMLALDMPHPKWID